MIFKFSYRVFFYCSCTGLITDFKDASYLAIDRCVISPSITQVPANNMQSSNTGCFSFFHSIYQGLPFLAFVVWCLSLLLNFSLADLSAKKERMEQRWTSNDFLSLMISHYTDRLVMQNPWLDWFYEMRPAPQGPALRHRSWIFERNLLEQHKVIEYHFVVEMTFLLHS